MVGSAGATSVMLRDAINDPSIRPAKTAMTPRSMPFLAVTSAVRAATAVMPASLPAAWQPQHPLGQDVAQDFRGPRLDGVRARAQELILPALSVADLARRTADVDGRLGHSLVELRPHELEDRSLGSGDSAALHGCHRAVAVELQRPCLDGVLRDLLPH